MNTKLILWDWNGTLLDDVETCRCTLNRLLARFGYKQQFSMEQYREVFGFPIVDYYRRAGFDFSRHSFDDLAKSYMADYLSVADSCPLFSDAQKTLEFLKNQGIREVVLSASPVPTLEHQVAAHGVRPYFEALLGLSDIYAKSKVEIGQAFLPTANVAPDEILMVGDSVHDGEVAAALGVRCVLCSKGHQAAHFLRETGFPVMNSLSRLPEYL